MWGDNWLTIRVYLWCVQENALSELPSPYLHFKSRAAGHGGSHRLISAKHRLRFPATSHIVLCRPYQPNLKWRITSKKCQTAQERIQAAPGAAPPGENSQEISGKPRIKPCSIFCCGESRVKQVHRQAKKHRHTEAFLLSWLFTFPNTAPCASNSDTMTPHVVRLEPNFALSCSLSGDLYRRWVSCPLLRFIVAIPQIPAVGLSKPFSRTICAHSGMLLSKSV